MMLLTRSYLLRQGKLLLLLLLLLVIIVVVVVVVIIIIYLNVNVYQRPSLVTVIAKPFNPTVQYTKISHAIVKS